MKRILFGLFLSVLMLSCKDEAKDTDDQGKVASESTAKPPVELLDTSMNASVQKSFEAYEKGDLDGFLADYDDNVRFIWSSGDSLIGKAAVKDYFAARRNLTQSIKFSNNIYLPIHSNVSPAEGVMTGKWMLHWVQVDVTYKSNKSLKFWLHNASHYNASNKIDYVAQYVDRGPLMAASK